MATEWFAVRDGFKRGPLTAQELCKEAAAGSLRPTDLLWCNRLAQPVLAAKVKGLFPSNAAVPATAARGDKQAPSSAPPLRPVAGESVPQPPPGSVEQVDAALSITHRTGCRKASVPRSVLAASGLLLVLGGIGFLPIRRNPFDWVVAVVAGVCLAAGLACVLHFLYRGRTLRAIAGGLNAIVAAFAVSFLP